MRKLLLPIMFTFKSQSAGLTLLLAFLMSSTLNAQVVKQGPSTVDAGDQFTYTINFTCPSTTSGDCNNTILSDFLPIGLDYETGTAGNNYDPSTGEWTFDFGTVPNGGTVSVGIVVNVPPTALSGELFENTATVTTSSATIVSNELETTVDQGFNIAYTDTHHLDKRNEDIFVTGAPQIINAYDIFFGNNSDGDLTNYVLEDILPAGQILNSRIHFESFFYCDGPFNYTVEIVLSDNSTLALGTDYFGETGPFSSANDYAQFVVTDPTILTDYLGITGNAEYPVGIRMTFPTLPQNCGHNQLPNKPNVKITAYYDQSITGVADPVAGDMIDNCATANSDGLPTGNDCGTVTFIPPVNELRNVKNLKSANPPFEPFEFIEFELRIAGFAGSVGTINTDLFGIDILPPEFTFIQLGSLDGTRPPTGAWNGNPVTINPGSTSNLPVITVLPDFQGTGGTALEFVWSDATMNNVTWPAFVDGFFTIYYVVQVNGATPAGDYVNTWLTSSDTPIDNCPYTIIDVDDLNNNGDTTDELCARDVSTPTIIPPGFAGLHSFKEVNGNLDNPGEFSKFPANGQVSPGGNINYVMCLENPFSAPIDNIVIVDVLPHVGDIGVVANNEFRESVWQPEFNATTLADLQAYVASIPGSILELSTECSPCLAADLGAPVMDLPGCMNPNWSTTAPTILSDVCAFKITLDPNYTLNQNDETCIDFNMNSPSNVPTDGSIAWNSFGFVGVKEDGVPLLASEPIKVGIEAQAGCVGPIVISNANQVTCTDGVPNSDGSLEISSLSGGDRYNWSIGSSYSGDTDYDNAIPTAGLSLPIVVANNLSNPIGSQDYTVRVFQGTSSCFTDVTVTLQEYGCPLACECPEPFSLCWDEVGFVEPPNDDPATFPYTNTVTDIDGSGVDVTITLFQPSRDNGTDPDPQQSYVSQGSRCGCNFNTELDPYLPCGEVFRNWARFEPTPDTIIMSFSEPIELGVWGFGGFKTSAGNVESAVASFTFFDGPNATGNQVVSTLPNPGGRTQINVGAPITEAINELQGTGLGAHETELYNGTYYYEGQDNDRGWTILDMGDAVIYSIMVIQYTVEDGLAPMDYVPVQPTAGNNSGYWGSFDFERCECNTVECPPNICLPINISRQ